MPASKVYAKNVKAREFLIPPLVEQVSHSLHTCTYTLSRCYTHDYDLTTVMTYQKEATLGVSPVPHHLIGPDI